MVLTREQGKPVHRPMPRTHHVVSAGRADTAGDAPRAASSILRLLLACTLALCTLPRAVAQEPARPLFQSDAPIAVTLQAPWRELLRKRMRDEVFPAVLAYTDAQGRSHRIAATVESRGLTRRRTCWFPPIRLRFSAASTHGTVFEGQRSLKMVTHCRSGGRYEQYYVLEMLAYRIYNVVTERSFRVRPLEVTYVDVATGKPDGPRFAFVIEPLGDMARRNGLRRARQVDFAPGHFNAPVLSRYMLFQYLIGNTDWAVLSGPRDDACCHNARALVGDAVSGVVPVPYDFDAAGLVDADYAVPSEQLPIEKVTQRLFRGFCVHNGNLPAARDDFLAHRPAIFALIEAEPRLDRDRRREALRYVQGFYDIIGNPDRFDRELIRRCRK